MDCHRDNEHRKMPEEYYQLLEELQALDFVLLELNLYLDTHPNDLNAVRQYNDLVRKRKAVRRQLVSIAGPLSHFGHDYVSCPWNWDDTPWPWQV